MSFKITLINQLHSKISTFFKKIIFFKTKKLEQLCSYTSYISLMLGLIEDIWVLIFSFTFIVR